MNGLSTQRDQTPTALLARRCSQPAAESKVLRKHAPASMEGVSDTEQPCFIDSPWPPFQRVDLEAWLKLMPGADLGLLVGAARTEWERRGLGSTDAPACRGSPA